MKWTTELPTAPGWYWVFDPHAVVQPLEHVELMSDDDGILCLVLSHDNSGKTLKPIAAEGASKRYWIGPLTIPAPPPLGEIPEWRE